MPIRGKHDMKPWLRLTIVTMTVGGGFAGLAASLQALFNSPGVSTFNLLVTVAFIGLYLFVLVSGLFFVYDPLWTGPLVAALAIQIPWISSPYIVYKFAAGFQAFITVGSAESANTVGLHFGIDFLLGGSWKFSLFQGDSLGVGVNIAALAILLAWKTLRSGRDATSPTNPESMENPVVETP
jgi:hypothetical protein